MPAPSRDRSPPGDLWLGPRCAVFDWNAGTLQTHRITRPTLGNEQPYCHHDRHFTPRKRQRHQCLAIGRLAKRRGILRSDTNRTIALFRHRRIIDDQHRIFTADQAIGLNEQFRLQWRRIPDAIRDEMVATAQTRPMPAAPPLAGRSCDRPVQSIPRCKADKRASGAKATISRTSGGGLRQARSRRV
jgi:hypothetical protein